MTRPGGGPSLQRQPSRPPRSAQAVAAIDPGIRTRDVLTLDVRDAVRARIIEALRAHPLVIRIASASTIPLDGMAPEVGAVPAPRTDLVRVRYRYVSPSYFDLFDVPLVSGRVFTHEEARAEAPVAILSATAAIRLWPGENAVGHTLRLVPERRTSPSARIAKYESVEVVGVARDVTADLGNNGPQTSTIHLPNDPSAIQSGLIVQVAGDPELARRALLTALDAAVPGGVQEMHKLQEFVAGRLYPFRAAYWVSSAVDLLALLLTITGVYGVLSYLVTQRAKEVSIRLALGARLSAIVTLVMRHSLRLAWIGLAGGVAIALGAARFFAWCGCVMMLKVYDPVAYAAGILVVFTGCIAASCVPAFRAARIDPMQTLRAD